MLSLLIAASSTVAFGSGGFVLGEKGRFVSIALDAEGRAVTAGWSDGAVVARYLEDGRRDPTFRSKPIARASFHGVAIDERARIVAAGTIERRAFVARFMPDGSLDESFGEFGVVRGNIGKSFLHDIRKKALDRFESVDIDSRGRIVVAGVARGFRPSGWSDWFFCRFNLQICWSYEITSIVARFQPQGPLDPSFAGTGYVLGKQGERWHTGPHDELMEVTVLPNDRIAAAGWAAGDETYEDERTIVVRFLPDGRHDDGFGSGGFVLSPLEAHAGGTKEVLYGLVHHGDRLITCGFSFDRERHIRALIKVYGARGELVSHSLANARQLAGSDIEDFVKCAVDSFGRISGVGFTDDEWSYSDEPDRALLARYRADGTLGERFSSWKNGRSVFGKEKNDGFYDLAIDREGRIWVVGSASGRTLVARFKRDLTLDVGAR